MLAEKKNILHTEEIYRCKTEKYLISINVATTHIIRRTIIPILTTIARFCLSAFFKIALTTMKTTNVGMKNGIAQFIIIKIPPKTNPSTYALYRQKTSKRIIKSAIQKRTVAFIFFLLSFDKAVLIPL